MANLMEAYKGRLAISEKYYAQKNNGAKMSMDKKMTTAMCIQNTAKFLNEALEKSVGTQRSDINNYKKFCLDITTIAMPNLIVNDIFMVQPMAGFSGYVTYMEYSLGNGQLVNNPFGMGVMDERRESYTAKRAVVEPLSSFTSGTTTVAFSDGKDKVGTLVCVKAGEPDQKVAATIAGATSKITATVPEGFTADRIAYEYEAEIETIPQEHIPTIKGHMEGIALQAHARRIAVYYSQIAAFQAKNEYGLDFESQIAQQAQNELQYEIDSEAVMLVKKAADDACTADNGRLVTWVDEELDTISYSMKAEGFARKLEQAKAAVFKTSQRFMPNWMLVSPDVMPILTFVPGFKAASSAVANGPYVAGEVAGMKVIVTPVLGAKVCYLGVLGADGKSAVGIYAPWMPIVPTQLLGFADGGMSQGFSTMYDMKILNDTLLAKIEVTPGDDAASFKELTA